MHRVATLPRAAALQGFVAERVASGAEVYTDEHTAYDDLPYPHAAVRHSAGRYVHGMAHTNGIESFWSMLKRGYVGTYHQLSIKHLDRYVSEFEGRHNNRPTDTADQMTAMVRGMNGKRLVALCRFGSVNGYLLSLCVAFLSLSLYRCGIVSRV